MKVWIVLSVDLDHDGPGVPGLVVRAVYDNEASARVAFSAFVNTDLRLEEWETDGSPDTGVVIIDRIDEEPHP